MAKIVEKLQLIAKKEKGYTGILDEIHQGLISQARRENRTSSKGKTSIQNLSDLLTNERRVGRLLDGNFGVLDKYETLFLDILKTDTSVILANAGEAMKLSQSMSDDRLDNDITAQEIRVEIVGFLYLD